MTSAYHGLGTYQVWAPTSALTCVAMHGCQPSWGSAHAPPPIKYTKLLERHVKRYMTSFLHGIGCGGSVPRRTPRFMGWGARYMGALHVGCAWWHLAHLVHSARRRKFLGRGKGHAPTGTARAPPLGNALPYVSPCCPERGGWARALCAERVRRNQN